MGSAGYSVQSVQIDAVNEVVKVTDKIHSNNLRNEHNFIRFTFFWFVQERPV